MKFYDKTKYAFIVALLRAQESKMLNAGEVERMLGAPDGREAYRVLNDLEYAKFLGDIERVEDFQIVINEGLVEAKQFLVRYSPYPELLQILWVRFDFGNLKALIKAKIQAKDFEEVRTMFFPCGQSSFEELVDFFVAERKSFFKENKPQNALEKAISKVISEALEIYAQTENPVLIDVTVDQAFYAYLKQSLPKIGSAFVTEYYQCEIDLKNLRAYLRLLALGKMEFFPQVFLQGGSLAQTKFVGNLDEFEKGLNQTVYFELVRKGIQNFLNNQSFVEFENEADVMLLNFIVKSHYITLGIEPVFAFFWIKENNAKIIRTIMVNKLNGVDSEEIRRKMISRG